MRIHTQAGSVREEFAHLAKIEWRNLHSFADKMEEFTRRFTVLAGWAAL